MKRYADNIEEFHKKWVDHVDWAFSGLAWNFKTKEQFEKFKSLKQDMKDLILTITGDDIKK